MAKKGNSRSNVNSTPTGDKQPPNLQIVIDQSQIPGIYSNVCGISINENEAVLNFAYIDHFAHVEKNTVVANTVARIILTKDTLIGLQNAISENLKMSEGTAPESSDES